MRDPLFVAINLVTNLLHYKNSWFFYNGAEHSKVSLGKRQDEWQRGGMMLERSLPHMPQFHIQKIQIKKTQQKETSDQIRILKTPD